VTAKRARRWSLARFHLQVSRPGLWFPAIWLYLLPLTADGPGATGRLEDAAFWVGLVYVCWPLNHWVYGWNDRVDVETDALNPRKGSWLFGARGTAGELATWPRAVVATQALCWPVLAWFGGLDVLFTGLGIALVLFLYNHHTRGLRGRPPGDLVAQGGYLLTVVLSAQVNGVPLPSGLVFGYLALFCAQSQLVGEVMDIVPDRAAGRQTTATVLGTRRTKWLIIGVVAAEVALLAGPLDDRYFAGALGVFWVWLLFDQVVLFREKAYSVGLMKLFGVLANVCAVLSMGWVWWRGGLG